MMIVASSMMIVAPVYLPFSTSIVLISDVELVSITFFVQVYSCTRDKVNLFFKIKGVLLLKRFKHYTQSLHN